MCEESFCTSTADVRQDLVGHAQCRACRILLGPFEQLLSEHPAARRSFLEPLPVEQVKEAEPEGIDLVETDA